MRVRARALRRRINRLMRLIGVEQAPVGHAERLISTFGGVLAITGMLLLERGLLGDLGAALVVASMGSSAVLLFAVPHGALSQPWAVLVGHVVSAVVGVTVARLVPDQMLAAGLAVGLSIGAMHYLRAIHPPGGATALTAVVGGASVQQLGYGFVVMPVLLNAGIMVAMALAINAPFAWRRYPAAWGRARPAKADTSAEDIERDLTHADFVAALHRIGTFVDITEDEFIRLRRLMREAAARRHMEPADIRLGAYYSNGVSGDGWSVRRIVDADPGSSDGNVIWRSVAGHDRNETGISTRRDFAAWARCEVVRAENAWAHAGPGEAEPEPEPEKVAA